MTSAAAPLIQVEGVGKHFSMRGGFGLFAKAPVVVHAVDDVSFTIEDGQTVGLVGESGCGKTTTGKMILALERPTFGRILYRGTDIANAGRSYRRAVQAVFQDPASSLSPRMRVQELITEPLIANGLANRKQQAERARELLALVGLPAAALSRFPHEFSGGQKQRIAVARALSIGPELIVLDEPVSALDVSIRAQIINLLQDLQEQFQLSYLLIAHDLAVVEHMSHVVAVMYLGEIVEIGPSEQIARDRLHPYTKALMSAVPIPDPTVELKPLPLRGEVPSPINPPSGCRFHPRCPMAMPICAEVKPELIEQSAGHRVACHLY